MHHLPCPSSPAAAGPGEQAAGPPGTQTQGGAIAFPKIPGVPFDYSNWPFFYALLATTIVLAFTWFFAATPWRPRLDGSKIWLTGPGSGQAR